jgi:5,10-methylene-tetrahydrofolate dehydrogenase/methenyl tetrahydrofolate cyclohydrolase
MTSAKTAATAGLAATLGLAAARLPHPISYEQRRKIVSDLSGKTAVVVGASRGLGRGIAGAFAEAGASVVAVARTGPALAELASASPNIRTEVADAADAAVAWSVIDQY